ncbi:MAG TPA: hypothetical protein VHY08_01040 [Bacillota bacterium]|nr:hypothetical protein [Bacillota bacterium]
MKKLLILLFTMSLVLFSGVAAFGLSSPTVTEGQWEVMGVVTSIGGGAIVGGEYGISPELAIVAELGSSYFSKIGVIYELHSNVAVTGGISGPGLFAGIIGSMPMGKSLVGIGQLDVKLTDDQTLFIYEGGVRYYFRKQWDLRGALIGAFAGEDNVVGLGFGVGYRF